eukprot:TRINITY_DN1834_c0_g2_i3.p1 TRINITY_DN1834_c0_g2~~TRINITY_DN1834_c0_g2_i3.p1  ORF type:complete len:2567 (-),score=480.65 TRINITY_DN1834_c0_g2_i3:159-7859(-)
METKLREKLISDIVQRIADQAGSSPQNSSAREFQTDTDRKGLIATSRIYANDVVTALMQIIRKLPLVLDPSNRRASTWHIRNPVESVQGAQPPSDSPMSPSSLLSTIDMFNLLSTCLAARIEALGLTNTENHDVSQSEESSAGIEREPLSSTISLGVFETLLSTFRELYPLAAQEVNESQKTLLIKLMNSVGDVFCNLSVLSFECGYAVVESSIKDQSASNISKMEIDLSILQYVNFNIKSIIRLLTTFAELCSGKKKDICRNFAQPIYRAIWNFIEKKPHEYSLIFTNPGSAEAKAITTQIDIIFQAFFGQSDNVKRRVLFWPPLMTLLLMCPSHMSKIWAAEECSHKDLTNQWKFLKKIDKAFKGKKGRYLLDVSLRCYVDVCKACSVLQFKDNILYKITKEIELPLQGILVNPSRPYATADGLHDAELVNDYLVSEFRLDPLHTTKILFGPCIVATASPVSKQIVIKSITVLARTGSFKLKSEAISEGLTEVAKPLKQYFYQEYRNHEKHLIRLRAERDRIATIPSPNVDALINLITMFQVVPELTLASTSVNSAPGSGLSARPGHQVTIDLSDISSLFAGLCLCSQDLNIPDLRNQAISSLLALYQPAFMSKWNPENPLYGALFVSSVIFLQLSEYMLGEPNLYANIVYQLLDVIIYCLESTNSFIETIQDVHQKVESQPPPYYMVATAKLEASVLLQLCNWNPDVVSKAATCCGLMCEQYDLLRMPNSFSYNYSEYKSLASDGVLKTGRVAQQKAIRTILKKVERQSDGNLEAWQRAYQRWKTLTQQLTQETDTKDQVKTEWQNFTHFLCALSSISKNRKHSLLSTGRPNEGSGLDPKGMPSLANASFVTTSANAQSIGVINYEQLIKDMLRLIFSENAEFRIHSTTALGVNLSPAGHPYLFQSLRSDVKVYIGEGGQINITDQGTQYVDQAMTIVRQILEQAVETSDLAFGDFEMLVPSFAQYITHLIFGDNSVRLRCKLCGLVEYLMSKKDFVVFRNENKFRNQLLQTIMEWTSDFHIMKADGGKGDVSKQNVTERNNPELAGILKLIKEKHLDGYCLRAIALLMKGLKLQEENVRPGGGETVGHSFIKYFSFLTRCHDRYRKDLDSNSQLYEHTVTALTNLLNSNADSSMDYFISMGYHEDSETRATFLDVLTNSLKQKTESEDLGGEITVVDKYNPLNKMLLDETLTAVLGLIEVIPITDADRVAQLLVHLFENNGQTARLLKAAIDWEVKKTVSPTTLFRTNSVASKMIGVYSRLIGTQYLKHTLQNIIVSICSDATSYEVDPDKVGQGEDAAVNIPRLASRCQEILDRILKSIDSCPISLRDIYRHLRASVSSRFPSHTLTAIGGFLFLRFICPCVAAPESFEVIEITPKVSTRRNLILITKVIQNLVNGVPFKEPYMKGLNSFIEKNQKNLQTFLELLADLPTSIPVPPTRSVKEDDPGALHYFISQYAEKMQTSTAFQDSPSFGEQLSVILSQLGPPSEPKILDRDSQLSPQKQEDIYSNVLFEEFTERYATKIKEREEISAMNVFYQKGLSKSKRPVFYYIARKTHAQIDKDILISYILTVLQPHFTKPYEIVFDAAFLDESHGFQITWCYKLWKLVPIGARRNMVAVYIILPSSYLRKFAKNLSRVVKNKALKKFSILSRPTLLDEYLEDGHSFLPKETVAQETEISSTFSRVNLKGKEIVLRISPSSIQVVNQSDTIFNQPVTPIDIISFNSISDLGVSGTGDSQEIVVKYSECDQLKLLSFASPSCHEIVQAISTSLARWKQEHRLADLETISSIRIFKSSDVAGPLLNIALLNLGSDSEAPRRAAYNMLSQLCISFKLFEDRYKIRSESVCLPPNSTTFICGISEQVAANKPGLTTSLLKEWLHAMKRVTPTLRHVCLSYVSVWLGNLGSLCKKDSQGGKHRPEDEENARIQEIIDGCINMTLEFPELYSEIHSKVWTVIAKNETLVSLACSALQERAARSKDISSETATYANLVVSLAAHNAPLVCDQIINRILTAVTEFKASSSLAIEESAAWREVNVLMRYIMMLSFENTYLVQRYMPELMYLIVVLFPFQSGSMRASAHFLLLNVLYVLCTIYEQAEYLRHLLTELNKPNFFVIFYGSSSGKPTITTELKKIEKVPVGNIERVASVILEILNTIRTYDPQTVNEWQEKLAKLAVAAMSFAPVILRTRAILLYGVMARAPVEASVVHQLLVFFAERLKNPTQSDQESDFINSVLLGLARIVPCMPPLCSLSVHIFWFAIAVLQLGDSRLFVSAISLLQSVVKTHDSQSAYTEKGFHAFYMQSRVGLIEKTSIEIEKLTGINFSSSFSFSVATILMKGLAHAATKVPTLELLETFFQISSNFNAEGESVGYVTAQMPFLRDTSYDWAAPDQFYSYANFPDTKESAALFIGLLSAFLHSIESEQEKLAIFKQLKASLKYRSTVFGVLFGMYFSWEFTHNEALNQSMMSLVEGCFETTHTISQEDRQRLNALMGSFLALQKSNTFQQITPSRNAAVSRLTVSLIDEINRQASHDPLQPSSLGSTTSLGSSTTQPPSTPTSQHQPPPLS